LNGGTFSSSQNSGRPLALGNDVDSRVRQHILRLRDEGSPISCAVVLAVSRAYLQRFDPIRYQLGGEQLLSKNTGQSILRRMNFVKRKATKAAKKIPPNFDQLRSTYYSKIQSLVHDHCVPDELIVNWDQTGVFLVPSSKYSMAAIGSKQVAVVGSDDKRQITALLTVTASGELLYPQLIYQGTTERCHPKYQFPAEYHIDHTSSHWSDSGSMIRL
jgi:hypothetical protein